VSGAYSITDEVTQLIISMTTDEHRKTAHRLAHSAPYTALSLAGWLLTSLEFSGDERNRLTQSALAKTLGENSKLQKRIKELEAQLGATLMVIDDAVASGADYRYIDEDESLD
jgi:BMFP domain-containing protein YqiC